MATALASLDAARTGALPAPDPAPTASLLVATDPALTAQAPDESLLLGAAPVQTPTTSAADGPSVEVDSQPVSWLDDLGTYGMPLLVGGALLLALTGPSGLRRLMRRRRQG